MIDASVLVVGGGAIGGVTAAKLTGALRRVAVLDASREHVERLRGEGLRLDELGEERRARRGGVLRLARQRARAGPRRGAGGGRPADRRLVEWGATNLGPGRLAQTTRGPFVVGELDGPPRERTQRLAEALGPAAEVRVSEDIRSQIWAKLLVNSVFSGLGAVAGLLYFTAMCSVSAVAAYFSPETYQADFMGQPDTRAGRQERFVRTPASERVSA